jgi:hypothetical protein
VESLSLVVSGISLLSWKPLSPSSRARMLSTEGMSVASILDILYTEERQKVKLRSSIFALSYEEQKAILDDLHWKGINQKTLNGCREGLKKCTGMRVSKGRTTA